MTKSKADRRAEVLKFIAANEDVPVAAGVNAGKNGCCPRFHSSTLRSMEQDGVLVGRIGNDGDRWYSIATKYQEQVELADRMVAEVVAEEKLVEDFKRAKAEYERLCDAIMNLFYPQAQRAFEARDEKLLRVIADECPESVCKIFVFDLIRQLKLTEGK